MLPSLTGSGERHAHAGLELLGQRGGHPASFGFRHTEHPALTSLDCFSFNIVTRITGKVDEIQKINNPP